LTSHCELRILKLSEQNRHTLNFIFFNSYNYSHRYDLSIIDATGAVTLIIAQTFKKTTEKKEKIT